MTRDEAMRLARTVGRECYRRWRVSENWEAVDMDSIVDEFLAEPPAPDVQAQWPRCAKCEHDAHPLDCAERGCLCPHGADVQAQIDAARERGIRESAGIVERCGLDGLRDKILAQIGMGKVQP